MDEIRPDTPIPALNPIPADEGLMSMQPRKKRNRIVLFECAGRRGINIAQYLFSVKKPNFSVFLLASQETEFLAQNMLFIMLVAALGGNEVYFSLHVE